MTRAVIITNPAAARSDRAGLDRAIRRLRDGGLQPEVLPTEGPGHAEKLARDAAAAGVGLLIAHGGDGTVMEVAAAVVGTGRPIGLLPAGTGNLLAGNLGISRRPAAAAEVILAGVTRVVDVGRLRSSAGERYFAVAAGAGFDADLMHHTHQRHKRSFGMSAYVATAVGLATGIVRARVTVEADGETHQSHAAMVMVANCGQLIPGVLWLDQRVSPDDGWLDVAVLDAATFAGAARVAWRLFSRRPDGAPGITMIRARRVSITTDPVLPVQADGEAAGYSPLTVELVPQALHVLAPRHG